MFNYRAFPRPSNNRSWNAMSRFARTAGRIALDMARAI